MEKKPYRAADGPMIMLIAFAIMLVAQLIASMVVLGIGEVSKQTEEIINCVSMIIFQLVFITTYLVYTKKSKITNVFSPKNAITVWSVFGAVLVALVCFFGFIGLAYYFEYLLGSIGYNSPSLDVNSTVGIALLVVVTVIAAPICEETVFRSSLLSGVSRVRRDELGVCIISGACFALMHINPSQTVYQFCLGTVAAYLTLKWRSVLPAMILHALSNAFALMLSYMEFGGAVQGFYARTGHDLVVTGLTCVLLPAAAVAIIWILCKYVKKAEQKKLADKYKREPQVVWIDEATKQPVFEGDQASSDTDGNRLVERGVSPFSGEHVFEDKMERQKELMQEYKANNGERSGLLGSKSYQIAFGIYFGITAFMWIISFLAGLVI